MSIISVKFQFLSVLLSLWTFSVFRTAEGLECGSATACQDPSLHAGTGCKLYGGNVCECKAGYANHVSSFECVEGTVCDSPSNCQSTEHNDNGLCTPTDSTRCQCADGYVHNSSGDCVASVTCGGLTCTADAAHTGACDSTTETVCQCKAGNANVILGTDPAIGTCVEGSVCRSNPPTTCPIADNHEGTGVCVVAGNSVCKCSPDYENKGSDRVCTLKSRDCGGEPCNANESQTGLCDSTVCECKTGSVHSTDGSGIPCMDICNTSPDCTTNTSVDNCTNYKGCDCAAGYGNAEDGTCVNICDVIAAAVGSSDPAAIKGYCSENSDGTCVANTGCKCTIGYVPDADGKCTVDICNTSPDCTTNTSADNCTDFKGCDCAAGYGNAADGTCVAICDTLDVSVDCAVNGDGTCTDPHGCNCDEGYGNNSDGLCVDICTAIDVFAVCDKDEDEYSNGVCTPSKGCNCSDYHVNDDDGTCKLITSTCGGKVCDASESQTGQCNTTGDGCACQSGFADNAGTCVVGATCNDPTNCTGDEHTGTCVIDNLGTCICSNPDTHAAGNDGTCVVGATCNDPTNCTGDEHTGTCVIDNLGTCICSNPDTHAAGNDGTCELIATTSSTGTTETTSDAFVLDSAFVSVVLASFVTGLMVSSGW